MSETGKQNMNGESAALEFLSGGFVDRAWPLDSTLPHPDAVHLGTVVRSPVDGRCWQTRRVRQRAWGSKGWRPTDKYWIYEWASIRPARRPERRWPLRWVRRVANILRPNRNARSTMLINTGAKLDIAVLQHKFAGFGYSGLIYGKRPTARQRCQSRAVSAL